MLFGRILITKALGSFIPIKILKFLIDTIAGTLKKKLFNFRRHVVQICSLLYENKTHDKIKLTVFYRDLEKVGLRMTDVDVMFNSLGLGSLTVPNRYFRKQGSLNFLIQCNYDTKCFHQLPGFYKNILNSFKN